MNLRSGISPNCEIRIYKRSRKVRKKKWDLQAIAQVRPEAEAISSQKVPGGVRIIKGEKNDAAAIIWDSQGIFSEAWETAFNEKKRACRTHSENVARFVSRFGE